MGWLVIKMGGTEASNDALITSRLILGMKSSPNDNKGVRR
jgi:hypothetical protein